MFGSVKLMFTLICNLVQISFLLMESENNMLQIHIISNSEVMSGEILFYHNIVDLFFP